MPHHLRDLKWNHVFSYSYGVTDKITEQDFWRSFHSPQIKLTSCRVNSSKPKSKTFPSCWVGLVCGWVCVCVYVCVLYYEYCCKVERGFCVIRRFVFLYSCQIVVYNHKSFALKTWNVTLSLKTWQLVTSTEILVKLESLWVNCQQNANDLPLLTSWNFNVMWHKEKKKRARK